MRLRWDLQCRLNVFLVQTRSPFRCNTRDQLCNDGVPAGTCLGCLVPRPLLPPSESKYTVTCGFATDTCSQAEIPRPRPGCYSFGRYCHFGEIGARAMSRDCFHVSSSVLFNFYLVGRVFSSRISFRRRSEKSLPSRLFFFSPFCNLT